MKPSTPLLAVIGTAMLFLCTPARSATFIIANGDVATFKSAITTSNGNTQDDTIELAVGGTYTLTAKDSFLNGFPQIGSDGGHTLTIHGNGATIVRSSAQAFRFFEIKSGANLTLSALTLNNGNPGSFHGGAIYNNSDETANATLTIVNCTISGNSGDYGGGIFNDGAGSSATLNISNSTFSNNTGTQYGGAIWNESGGIVMNVTNCTFIGNSAVAHSAGAIQFDGSNGTATGSITNSTFTQNTAANYGGAIGVDGFSGSATLPITNCTFNQNSAQHGGGIAIDGSSGSAVVMVTNCTFSGNSGTILGGGLYLSTTTSGTTSLQIGNTILKTGASGANFGSEVFTGGAVTITSQGANVSNDAAGGPTGTAPGGFLNGTGDIRNTDPLLGALANNGGPTNTIALQVGSPAIDHGNNAIAPARDQRYYLRSGAPDSGAFEFSGTLAPITADSVMMHGAKTFGVNLPLSGTVGVEPRNGGASGNFLVIANFATSVTAASANVTSGTGNATLGVSGSQVTVNLTNVTNAQQITVTISNVSDGIHTNNVNIPARFLQGDTTADSLVNAADIGQTKSKSGQIVDDTNFRNDVNVDGLLNSSDISLVKNRAGTAIP